MLVIGPESMFIAGLIDADLIEQDGLRVEVEGSGQVGELGLPYIESISLEDAGQVARGNIEGTGKADTVGFGTDQQHAGVGKWSSRAGKRGMNRSPGT